LNESRESRTFPILSNASVCFYKVTLVDLFFFSFSLFLCSPSLFLSFITIMVRIIGNTTALRRITLEKREELLMYKEVIFEILSKIDKHGLATSVYAPPGADLADKLHREKLQAKKDTLMPMRTVCHQSKVWLEFSPVFISPPPHECVIGLVAHLFLSLPCLALIITFAESMSTLLDRLRSWLFFMNRSILHSVWDALADCDLFQV
jgi:hypothetical protein